VFHLPHVGYRSITYQPCSFNHELIMRWVAQIMQLLIIWVWVTEVFKMFSWHSTILIKAQGPMNQTFDKTWLNKWAGAQSVQCLVTGWTTGWSRFDPRQRRKDFFCNLCPDRLWGPPSFLYNGYRGPFPRGWSAAGAWTWPLTPSSVEVENE
jgi:hypothetical protein